MIVIALSTLLAWTGSLGDALGCDKPCGFGGICDGKDNHCEFFSNGYHCNLGEGASCPDGVDCWYITGKTYYTSKTCKNVDGPLVVGYLPVWHLEYGFDPAVIDWSALTHIMMHGTTNGAPSFEISDHARVVAKMAKERGVIAYQSFPGQNADWITPERAPATAKRMVECSLELGVDGIDVDLENNAVASKYYIPFMKLLWKEARQAGLGFSAAIGEWEVKDGYQSDEVLDLLDFLNIMIYDLHYGEEEPHQHSPYDWFVDVSEYFLKHKKITPSRVNLGIPFYGLEFLHGDDKNGGKGRGWDYFLDTYPSAMHQDNYGDVAYYNGLDTVRRKAMYALEHGANVMIWELGQDVFNSQRQFSLLRQIKTVFQGCDNPCTHGGECDAKDGTCEVFHRGSQGYHCNLGKHAPCPSGVHCWYIDDTTYYTSTECGDVEPCVDACDAGGSCDRRSDGYCAVYDNGYHCFMGKEPCPANKSCWKIDGNTYWTSLSCAKFQSPQDSVMSLPAPIPISGEGASGEDYSLKDNVSCRKQKIKVEKNGVMKTYRTVNFEKAKAKCDQLGEECVGVMDSGCDGKGKYNLCRKSDKPLRTKPGSCIYIK